MIHRSRPVRRLAFVAAWLLPAAALWAGMSADYVSNRLSQGGATAADLVASSRARAGVEMLPFAAQVVRLQAGIGGSWIEHPDGLGAVHRGYPEYGRWFWWFLPVVLWLVAFPVAVAFVHLRAMELAERRATAELPSLWGKFERPRG